MVLEKATIARRFSGSNTIEAAWPHTPSLLTKALICGSRSHGGSIGWEAAHCAFNAHASCGEGVGILGRDGGSERVPAGDLGPQGGTVKPDEKIYQIACDTLGVDPSETAFVDDVATNVVAARHFGMRGIVFRSADGLRA